MAATPGVVAQSDRASLVALARLEPASKIVGVSADVGGVIEEVLIAEGDRVENGQILVRLTDHALRETELETARIELERAKLGPLDVEGQQARVRSIEAELDFAREEVDSQEGLSEKGFSAGREFRNAQLRVRRAEEQLNEARATLKRMEANVDLSIREAANNVTNAEAKLEQSLVRAPLSATVLRVRHQRGERVGGGWILSLGTTDEMNALGEIHANEIRLVRVGQRARFTSGALPGPVEGVVTEVGGMIFSNHITGEDPTAPKGLRVVLVRVRLEPNELTGGLTNLEGQLRIFLEDDAASD